MQKLPFGEGLMAPSVAGVKKISLRRTHPGVHEFKKDEIVLGVFKDGLDVLLRITADTEKKPFGQMTNEEAQEDGFDDAGHAFSELAEFYSNLRKTDTLAIVRYEILQVEGVPVVAFNENIKAE